MNSDIKNPTEAKVNEQVGTKPGFTRFSLLRRFLKGSLHFFVWSIAASFGVTLTEMLSPQVVRFTIDSVIGQSEPELPEFLMNIIQSMGGVEWFRTNLLVLSGVLVLLALIGCVCKYFVTVCVNKGSETLMKTMRDQVYHHIQFLPFDWHMKNKTGDIIQRCTSDADRVCVFISEQLTSILRIVILMVLSLTFMYSMNTKLALISTVCIPVVILYSMYFHGKIAKHFHECDENEGILSTIAQENLTGVRVVRAFGREKYEKMRFKKQGDFYANLWVKLMDLMSWFWSIGDFISGLQVMLVIVFGAVFCVNGEMTPGTFIAFASYNAILTWPLRQLGRVISEMSKAGVSVDRIMYIMNSETEKDAPEATTPPIHGEIDFSHVSFDYGTVPVLKDISFHVPAGTTLGILGGTGSGKSTLMLLLNRLYDLKENSGHIRVDGHEIETIERRHLRSNIGMVLQEPFLFSKTIGENISITEEGMETEKIRRYAKIACVDEAIDSLQEDYDTVVGERGVTLSGGQKQRVAIARMLTQNTPIMVFDDSLSAVDAETDEKIRHALLVECKNATKIFISHRVTTLMAADQLLVLDKGEIAERGTPRELYEQGGIYRKIYDMQMGTEENN